MEFEKDIDKECAFNVKPIDGFCSEGDVVQKLVDLARKIDPEKNAVDVLKNRYKCEDEICVLNKVEVRNIIGSDKIEKNITTNFKPTGPGYSTDWLSNKNIDDVLDQIQKKYTNKHFLHIPFQMIDFEKHNKELARLNWQEEYAKGFRTFGTIINTDKYSGSGKHWFAIFGDFLDDSPEFTIEYFNSSGEKPVDEIIAWMAKMRATLHFFDEQGNEKKITDVIASTRTHQFSNTECGVYSLYYIISRLDGVPVSYFQNNIISDDTMYEFRKYLFRSK